MNLCSTNKTAFIHNVGVISTIFSDHNLVELTLYIPQKITGMQATKSIQIPSSLNFHKVDCKCIQKEVVEHDWTDILTIKDIEIMLHHFTTVMYDICNTSAPERMSIRKYNTHGQEDLIAIKSKIFKSSKLASVGEQAILIKTNIAPMK